MVVLSADPRAVAPATIADVEVRATYLAGRRVPAKAE
jgi:predicted amidohydrolase YtcJ